MSITDYPLTPEHVPTLRYQAVGFLTQQHRAVSLWHQMIVHEEQVWAPPDLEHLPAQQRAQWLAHEQATHLSRARLYHLDEAGTDLATRVGAELRAGTVPMPWPPSQYGMVLCPNGLGYSQDGMRLIACHWSPLQGTPDGPGTGSPGGPTPANYWSGSIKNTAQT